MRASWRSMGCAALPGAGRACLMPTSSLLLQPLPTGGDAPAPRRLAAGPPTGTRAPPAPPSASLQAGADWRERRQSQLVTQYERREAHQCVFALPISRLVPRPAAPPTGCCPSGRPPVRSVAAAIFSSSSGHTSGHLRSVRGGRPDRLVCSAVQAMRRSCQRWKQPP